MQQIEINDVLDMEEIVQKYSPLVKSICYRITWDREIADEAFQETWIEVKKSIGTFKNESKISTWVFKIAYRTVLRYVKKEKVYSQRFLRDYIEDQSEYTDPPADANYECWIKSTCNHCLTGFLYCLTFDDRMLYILRDVVELEYKTIEAVLEVKSVNLRQRLVRIRKRLKNFLRSECVLANPASKCHCRILNHVKNIHLDKEFEQIRLEMKNRNIYKIADDILPKIEYLKNKLGIMSHFIS